MPETPTLTAGQRAQLKAALDREWPMPTLMDDVAETVAHMVADAEQRGWAEVSAAVEAVLQGGVARTSGGDGKVVSVHQVRAALADPAAAVARIKEQAWDEGAAEGIRMHNRHQAWMLVNPYRADRIGGDA